jgi:ribosomal protein S18 acetylase RimI-like enzyme
LKIREATPDDLPSILQIATSTSVFTPEEILCLEQDVLEVLDGDQTLVYEDNNQILGFIQYGPLPITTNSWCMYWIAVNKTTQHKGVGCNLVKHMENDILSKKGRIILIETSSTNKFHHTRNFYLKSGYHLTAIIYDYYSTDDHKYIFRRSCEPDA